MGIAPVAPVVPTVGCLPKRRLRRSGRREEAYPILERSRPVVRVWFVPAFVGQCMALSTAQGQAVPPPTGTFDIETFGYAAPQRRRV